MSSDDQSSAPAVQRILRCVQQRTGLCFRPAQLAATSAAIMRAMQRVGESQPDDYAVRLERDLESLDDLIAELVVGETYFFRFPEQFAFIRETIASIMEDERHQTHPLRVWSAGCASGEEAYSLAILAKEMQIHSRTHILATDISRFALERAKSARYRDWSFRGADADRAKHYAALDAGEFVIREDIRKCVHFAYLNLALDVYPSHVTGTRDLDLILCRNVLIYFDTATIARVARRMHDSLLPGGWLVTAAGDPPLDDFAPFHAVTARGGVYYQRRPANSKAGVNLRASNQAATQDDAIAGADAPTVGSAKPATSITNSASTVQSMPASQHLVELRALLDAGEYEQVLAITKSQLHNAAACVLHVKALANDDAVEAEVVCRQLVGQHPLSVELCYLHAVLLMERRRDADAIAAIRKTLYLDRSVAIAHFVLGSLARRMGDIELARRSFTNAHAACLKHSATDIVRFAEDETYSSLIRAIELQLVSFRETPGGTL